MRDVANLPRPPTRPHEDECCHRGCEPCIFDYYDRAVARWEMIVRERGFDPVQVMAAPHAADDGQ